MKRAGRVVRYLLSENLRDFPVKFRAMAKELQVLKIRFLGIWNRNVGESFIFLVPLIRGKEDGIAKGIKQG